MSGAEMSGAEMSSAETAVPKRPRAPVEGASGAKPLSHTKYKKILQISAKSSKKNRKSIISEKLTTAQKNSFIQKKSARSIQINPANLTTFEESRIFGAPFRRVWAPLAPKHDMV